MKNLNSADVLRSARDRLKASGIESGALDAIVLLAFTIKKSKEWIFAHDYVLKESEYRTYLSYVEQRMTGVPVKYIINKCEFMGIDFYVDKNVLIPRADTEILAERLIHESKRISDPNILDLCTGSGCIAVSAAYYNKASKITAIDISLKTLEIAKRNALSAGVLERIHFLEGDLFDPINPAMNQFDIIASNPPYIPKAEMNTLSAEVKMEPFSALCAGESGLEFFEIIADRGYNYLKPNGLLLFEIGCNQAERVVEIMNKNGYNNINIYRDLAGLDRVAEGVRP